MVTKGKPILSRRFVRLQAIQHSYTFYIHKQANYQCALNLLREAFAFDSFAEPPIDQQEQAMHQKQAVDCFAAAFNSGQKEPIQLSSYPIPVQTAVQDALAHEQTALHKDLKRLKNGWHATWDSLQKDSLWLLQLLIEWKQVGQKQANKVPISQQAKSVFPISLINNQLLENLQRDASYQQLIKEHGINWRNHLDLVINGFNDWFKAHVKDQLVPTESSNLTQEKQVLNALIQQMIVKKSSIQDFFSGLDLSWTVHQPIVKHLITQVFENLATNKEKNTSLGFWGINQEWEGSSDFYDALITHTLEQDQKAEAIIQQHSKNWSIERVVLLDKIIIKLALTEMMCLATIPIKVSINEYIELSKLYSTPKSRQFINGVLDAVAKTL